MLHNFAQFCTTKNRSPRPPNQTNSRSVNIFGFVRPLSRPTSPSLAPSGSPVGRTAWSAADRPVGSSLSSQALAAFSILQFGSVVPQLHQVGPGCVGVLFVCIWQLAPHLHCSSWHDPIRGLIRDSNGNLRGTTTKGGTSDLFFRRPKRPNIPHRGAPKQAAVSAVELARAFVSDIKRRDAFPRCLPPKLLLILKRTHGGQQPKMLCSPSVPIARRRAPSAPRRIR
jgi:hypothetical protein